ncbi:hypothetical protein Plhal304r1_c024g0083141 [Plasmopara halstedii]
MDQIDRSILKNYVLYQLTQRDQQGFSIPTNRFCQPVLRGRSALCLAQPRVRGTRIAWIVVPRRCLEPETNKMFSLLIYCYRKPSLIEFYLYWCTPSVALKRSSRVKAANDANRKEYSEAFSIIRTATRFLRLVTEAYAKVSKVLLSLKIIM